MDDTLTVHVRSSANSAGTKAVHFLFPFCDTQFDDEHEANGMNLALNRDQRRLAVIKLASLSSNDPLRQKYEAWICALDERLAAGGNNRLIVEEYSDSGRDHQPPGSVTVEIEANSSLSNHELRAKGAYRERLISENDLLRRLLERFL